jgi:predicted AlkP superfamily phosphohydrolase/phosphomutase
VGLDAACWEYLNPLLEAGRMPTLQRLMNSGSWGTLHSTMPPWTPTAWSSLVTGKNPGKHGVFDMTWRRPGSYELIPTNANVRVGTPFWHYLNEHGLQVGLVNIPFTYPPQPVNGFMVTGFGTPSSARDVTYPPNLLTWIEQKFGTYEPAVSAKVLQSAPPLEILETEIAHQTQQVQIAAELSQNHSIDVLIINLMLTDHANHKMPHMEQVQEAYCQADADLGDLIGAFSPDNVMLISDHGSSRLQGDFLLYAWLRDQGYYVQKRNTAAQRVDALNWLLLQWLQNHHSWLGAAERLLRRAISKSFFKLPASIQRRFWKQIEKVYPLAQEYVLWSREADYQQTKVFPGSAYAGLLYLNLVDREETGSVSSEARQVLEKEIVKKLRQLKEPGTGRPLFSNIYTAEELYTGSATTYAPALILDSYDKGWNIRTSRYATMPEQVHDGYFVKVNNGRDFGWHSRDGIFILSGPDFITGEAKCEGDLVDIPATLLHLYDVPLPDDYDGQVLQEVLTPELRQQPIRFQAGDSAESQSVNNRYSDEEAEEVLEHLKALGYLD